MYFRKTYAVFWPSLPFFYDLNSLTPDLSYLEAFTSQRNPFFALFNNYLLSFRL